MADNNVGLDIGSSSVKSVEIKMINNALTITEATQLSMNTESVADGAIIDYAEVTEQIRSTASAANFTTKNVNIALKGSGTIARLLDIPIISSKQIKTELLYIVDQYMDVDPEEYAIDYNIVSINTANATAKIQVGAVRKDVLSDYVSVLQSADLSISTVNVESLSLCNLYKFLQYPDNKTSMILHIGHSSTLVIILKDGYFSYHETHSTAGSYCNNLLVNLARVPEESAEIVKMEPELSPYKDAAIKVITQNFIPELLSDIKKTVANYNLLGGDTPSRIYLSGGCATLYGIEEAISEDMKASVSIMEIQSQISIESEKASQLLEKSPAILNLAIATALK